MPRSDSKIQLKWPHWYYPDAPLGAAVRYVASLSGCFNWVGIYILKDDCLELGPFLGEPTEHTEIPVGLGICGAAVAEDRDLNIPHVSEAENYLACNLETQSELVILIRDKKGKILGQMDIDSHTPAAFGPEEEEAVKKVAQELGTLCSRDDFINWKENESRSRKK
ncbi:MAG: GAF domain-containing protein [Bdellovibrionia bacterium]